MPECKNCRQALDETDQFCRTCGMAVTGSPSCPWSRRPMPSPEQAAGYWRNFFRPFFTMAFVFFGVFLLFALIMIVVWFYMFHR
jgi:hypothetical protein